MNFYQILFFLGLVTLAAGSGTTSPVQQEQNKGITRRLLLNRFPSPISSPSSTASWTTLSRQLSTLFQPKAASHGLSPDVDDLTAESSTAAANPATGHISHLRGRSFDCEDEGNQIPYDFPEFPAHAPAPAPDGDYGSISTPPTLACPPRPQMCDFYFKGFENSLPRVTLPLNVLGGPLVVELPTMTANVAGTPWDVKAATGKVSTVVCAPDWHSPDLLSSSTGHTISQSAWGTDPKISGETLTLPEGLFEVKTADEIIYRGSLAAVGNATAEADLEWVAAMSGQNAGSSWADETSEREGVVVRLELSEATVNVFNVPMRVGGEEDSDGFYLTRERLCALVILELTD